MCLYNIILVEVFITQELVYVISTEIGLWAGWSVVQIPVEARELFIFSKMSRPALGPTQSPNQWETLFFMGLKWPDQLWVPPNLLINGYPCSLWG